MDRTRTPRSRRLRWLLTAAVVFVFAPWLGCSTMFEAPSTVDSLRVLAVVADKPYAKVGETVNFQMTYDAAGSFAGTTPQITWLGGCFDPLDDTYYGCFATFEALAKSIASGGSIADLPIAQGVGLDHFEMTMPASIVKDHPPPASGSNYGLAYVFFAVCAGHVQPIPIQTDAGPAGSFPLGCFDSEGQQISAEGFVAGYTQVYVFADGRTNANPTAKAILIQKGDGATGTYDKLGATPVHPTVVKGCSESEESRRQLGCGNNPYQTCQAYTINIEVNASVAEIDPSGDENGKPVHEAVWVDWYTDGGDFDSDVSLVYDPQAGLLTTADRSVNWIPPPGKGIHSIWAVLHDARGGGSVLQGYVDVK